MNKNYYAIIMAGGVGSRFWPVSKEAFPKQFHDMLGNRSDAFTKDDFAFRVVDSKRKYIYFNQ